MDPLRQTPPLMGSTIHGILPTPIQTASIKAQHGRHLKSNWTTVAPWFSNTPEREERASRLLLSQPLPKKILAKRSGKLRSRRTNVSAKASNCDRRTAVSGYFSSLITAHSALFTSFSPLFPTLQSSPLTSPRLRRSRRLLPAGQSSPTAVQEPPAKSKFLAVPQKANS